MTYHHPVIPRFIPLAEVEAYGVLPFLDWGIGSTPNADYILNGNVLRDMCALTGAYTLHLRDHGAPETMELEEETLFRRRTTDGQIGVSATVEDGRLHGFISLHKNLADIKLFPDEPIPRVWCKAFNLAVGRGAMELVRQTGATPEYNRYGSMSSAVRRQLLARRHNLLRYVPDLLPPPVSPGIVSDF